LNKRAQERPFDFLGGGASGSIRGPPSNPPKQRTTSQRGARRWGAHHQKRTQAPNAMLCAPNQRGGQGSEGGCREAVVTKTGAQWRRRDSARPNNIIYQRAGKSAGADVTLRRARGRRKPVRAKNVNKTDNTCTCARSVRTRRARRARGDYNGKRRRQ
jgi:hypothetical protein